MAETITALQVPAGLIPTIEDGIARLEHLRANGPSPHAFTFREPFPGGPPATRPGELMFTGIVEELGRFEGATATATASARRRCSTAPGWATRSP
jgi:hypothetical protein